MAIQFLSSLSVTGSVSVSSVAQDNSSYTGILVWDGSALKYRTKTQIRSDIGAGTGSMSSFSVTNGTTTGSISNGGTLTLTAGTGMSIGLILRNKPLQPSCGGVYLSKGDTCQVCGKVKD